MYIFYSEENVMSKTKWNCGTKMLASRDTPGGSWGFIYNNDLQLSYGTNINKCIKTRTKHNTLRALLPAMTIKRTRSGIHKPCRIAVGSIMLTAELEHFISVQKPRFNDYNTKETEDPRTYYKIQEYPRAITRVGESNTYLWRTAWIEELKKNCDYEHKVKLIRSNPYIGKSNLSERIGYQPESPQNKKDELDKNLPTYLQKKANPYLLFKTANRKSQYFVIVSGSRVINQACPFKPYLVTDYMPAYLSKLGHNTYVKNTSPMVSVPQMKYAEYILKSTNNVERGVPQENKKKETQHCSLNSRTTYSSIIITLGPNLKQQCVQTKKGKALYITDYCYDSPNRQNFTHKAIINQLCRKSDIYNNELLATRYQRTGVYGRQEYNINQSSLLNLKKLFGPYAQIQTVYNVKEKGTSQQFKKRSQGIGSGSVSGGDNSSTSSKRRTIKIESGCSFSVEFIGRGKKSESQGSSSEPDTDKSSKGKNKSLHRCLCTTSFPTDDKKLKKRPCDSGVCVPGKCSASECFKRLQQKYGSKNKKSDSDVSSSQASQTKKKGKDNKKILKEKGSKSISTYKESVQEKVIPPKKPAEPCMKKFCRMLQFWKKDKRIDLKPAVIGTDISVKGKGKEFGSNAATQKAEKGKKATKKDDKGKTVKQDKKKGKKGQKIPEKDVKSETIEKDTKKRKKGKTAPEKDVKGETGEKDTKKGKKGKKGKTAPEKDVKGETVEKDTKKRKKGKTAPEKDVKSEAVKKDTKKKKKGKTAPEKDVKGETGEKDTKKGKKGKKGKTASEKDVKDETVEKDTKKGKKGKTAPKKGAKDVKTETRGTGRGMKRALKPYECEPGVCSPKVCNPKECYERKFPPPPPPEKTTSFTKFKKCLRKLCCKRPAADGKVAATQSPRTGSEKTPGMTVYQEKGTSGPKTGKKRVQKGETPGVTPHAIGGPVAGGDVPMDKQLNKQSPYSGIKYFQSVDNERNTTRQGVNIGSDCECSVEFYKMLY